MMKGALAMDGSVTGKANGMVKGCSEAYLWVMDENGRPAVSAVSPVAQESILEAHFPGRLSGDEAKRLLWDRRATLSFRPGDGGVSHAKGDEVTLTGEAEVCTDQPTKSKFWRSGLVDRFPKGETDPDYCVIRFVTKRAFLRINGESAEFAVDGLLNVMRQPQGCGGCGKCGSCEFKGSGCPGGGCAHI